MLIAQRFKGFAKAHTHRFDIGVGEHEVLEQMGQGLPIDRHVQITHVGEIRLSPFARQMHLLKDDLLFRSRLGTPLGNVAL